MKVLCDYSEDIQRYISVCPKCCTELVELGYRIEAGSATRWCTHCGDYINRPISLYDYLNE